MKRSPKSPASEIVPDHAPCILHEVCDDDATASAGESRRRSRCRRIGAPGYAILARRYRTRHGEIDIVARDGETIVFVEVKAKESADFGRAAHAVTAEKQRRVISMAVDYLARHRPIAAHVDLTWSRLTAPTRRPCYVLPRRVHRRVRAVWLPVLRTVWYD